MCVMVVEDDFLIRLILVEELEDAGFNVKQAETGDQAITMLDGIEPPLSILVTDIHMPGSRNGLDVAAHIREVMPRVPVIFTTGRPDAMIGRVVLGHQQVLVRKPYIPSDVVQHVRGLLSLEGVP